MPATNSGVHFAAYGVKAGAGLLLRRAPCPLQNWRRRRNIVCLEEQGVVMICPTKPKQGTAYIVASCSVATTSAHTNLNTSLGRNTKSAASQTVNFSPSAISLKS
jgi:hypothetical protein